MTARTLQQSAWLEPTPRAGSGATVRRLTAATVTMLAITTLSALSLTVAVPVVQAADDAGVQSVFVHGAGNRALALGGAYAALADDASAPIWNPGGLGWLERNSLYATHTNLIGMGFSEQFGSVVVPSWRIGVFSLSLRSFGVDGIEQRDDRNALLNDDLSDRETELAVGYGREFGAAWSVGGTLKWQHQKLAGYSDGAVGMDLGLMVRPLLAAGVTSEPATALRMGLAFRNVVQPTLRLDSDNVPDPAGIRLGTAWSHPFGEHFTALATVDVEKTQYVNTHLHAGLEVELVKLLALRVGTRAGDLTAGMGVSWRDLTLDYAFEDNPIEPVHRIGLQLDFGSTTSERKQAALAAREQEVQQRLVDAFETENRAQVYRLLTSARTALAAWRYDDAMRLIAAATVLDPDHPDLATLEAAALRGEAERLAEAGDYTAAAISYGRCLAIDPADTSAVRGLAAVRQASDQQAARSDELRILFAVSLEAYTDEDYLTARDGFAELLRRQPGDAEAQEMLRHTEQTMRLRGTALAEQARALAVAGEWQQAEIVLAEAAALAPDDPAVARAQRALAIARSRDTGPAGTAATSPTGTTAAAAATPNLTSAQRNELAALYRSGMAAADAGRHNDAIRYWELVWSIDPQYQQVSDNLKREYLARGMEAFATGSLDRAVNDWEQAVRIDPEDTRARGYLQRALDQQARIRQFPEETP